ncbi:hypothetical protein ACFV0O_40585 [Kitasatospora sp. NPDC059577]|uniref:hypothetical protein n=1 Tax=Kitasatospora sp. NPDC059577 TaxID=3346873 RepID=UPI0036B19692
MNRRQGALCWAALLVAVAVVVAVRTQAGSGGPRRHEVVLPEPAPASAQWIVDNLSSVSARPEQCPAPTLATLAVLDSDGQGRAEVFWLVDNVDVCSAVISANGARSIGFGSVDSLIADRLVPFDTGSGAGWYTVTAFRGRVENLRINGDTDHVLGPVRTRTVDLGGGKLVTFVSYGIRIPEGDQDLTLFLCPPVGDCRDTSFHPFDSHQGDRK